MKQLTRIIMTACILALFSLIATMFSYAMPHRQVFAFSSENLEVPVIGSDEATEWLPDSIEWSVNSTYLPNEPIIDFDLEISDYLNPELDYLILVNDDHPYDFNSDYALALQDSLIKVPDVYGEATPVEEATYIAFTKLQADLAANGIIIGLFSAWRSMEDQQAVYDYYSNLDDWANSNKVMLPGYSEHHTGLVINFFAWHQFDGDAAPVWCTITAERQAEIPEYQIIRDTLADYGFIERYPAGKEAFTGVPCEPYEIRFVGYSNIAHAIMDNNYSLEEYLDLLSLN